MERGNATGFLERQGYSKKSIMIAIVMVIILLIIFVFWMLIFKTKNCNDESCYADAISSCKKVSFNKEDAQAVWRYTILGDIGGDVCKIRVELLRMKEGTIDAEVLQGKGMICNVMKSDYQNPEKDMKLCSGPLKEELQDIIIQRMHNYILKNLGEVKESFSDFN